MRQIARKLKALYRDERGADMVEYILIIAAIGLPILALVVFFAKDIKEWVLNLWESIKGDSTDLMEG